MAAVGGVYGGQLARRLLRIFARAGQLQQGIVGVGGHGQGMEARHQVLAGDVLPGLDGRPVALAQPHGDELLHHLAILGIEVQRLPQGRFRRGQAVVLHQHPAHLAQRRLVVADHQAIDGRGAGNHRRPLLHRPVQVSGALQQAAQIDVGGREIGADGDRGLQRGDGPGRVARRRLQARQVEVGDEHLGVVGVQPHPDLVELLGQMRLAGLGEARGRADDVA